MPENEFPYPVHTLQRRKHFFEETLQISMMTDYFQVSFFHLTEIQELIDQRQQILRVTFHQPQLLNDLWIITQFQGSLNRSHNQCQRSTELVRNIGKESQFVDRQFLHPARHLQNLVFLVRNLLVLFLQQSVLAGKFLLLGRKQLFLFLQFMRTFFHHGMQEYLLLFMIR